MQKAELAAVAADRSRRGDRVGRRHRYQGRSGLGVVALAVATALVVACSPESGPDIGARTAAGGGGTPPAGAGGPGSGSATSPGGPTTPGGPSVTAPPLSPFTGDPFFDPGDTPPGPPGQIIRSRQVDSGGASVVAWQVLHWSRTAQDEPVAVSATVLGPAGQTNNRPVFAYTHSTIGMGDQCALTNQPAATDYETSFFPQLLEDGMTIVVPDYQGLGTPGDHAYQIGQSEARNTLDAVRAASQIVGTGVGADSPVVSWGHSQGGAASAFTAEVQPTYAPEIELVGSIVGAGPTDATFELADTLLLPADARGFIPMFIAGLRAGYPQLAADDVRLSHDALQALRDVSSMCSSEALSAFESTDLVALFASVPLEEPQWQAAMAANRAGDRYTPVPVFIYTGELDGVVPPSMSHELLARYCAAGVTASLEVYPDRGHTDALDDAFADIVDFTRDRLRGKPAPDDCT